MEASNFVVSASSLTFWRVPIVRGGQHLGCYAGFQPARYADHTGKMFRRNRMTARPAVNGNRFNAAFRRNFVSRTSLLDQVSYAFVHVAKNDYYSHYVKRLNPRLNKMIQNN